MECFDSWLVIERSHLAIDLASSSSVATAEFEGSRAPVSLRAMESPRRQSLMFCLAQIGAPKAWSLTYSKCNDPNNMLYPLEGF